VHPGDVITVYGHWYTITCNDTGQHDPLQPLPAVNLTLTLPSGDTKPLGKYSPAGPDMGFTASVHIPATAPAGIATVSDNRTETRPATFPFRIATG
jgi:hypothetical protein